MRGLLRLALAASSCLPLSRSSPVTTGASSGAEHQSPGQTGPPPPSRDPWYQAPPAGWEQTSPGAVLRVRPAAHLARAVGPALAAWQVLFRTSNSSGGASWAVTTVFVPGRHWRCNAGEAARCGHALLSYQTPYDSASLDASPSHALRAGEPGAAYGEVAEALFRGWFVSVPDYEGPAASYTAGVASGLATIDSVRAVLAAAGNWGMRSQDAKVALFGYSGGALASEFAAELAETYAPELQFAGMAVGGIPAVVATVFDQVNGQAAAGLYASGLIGMTSQHPEARAWLTSRLRATGPANATGFWEAGQLDGYACVRRFRGRDIHAYFTGGRADVRAAPAMQAMLAAEGVMGAHGTPRMPTFVYKAVGDELSPVAETDALVRRLCAAGARILYRRNGAGDHAAEWVNGRAAAFAFLASVLEESFEVRYGLGAGCEVYNVSIDLTTAATAGAAAAGGWWSGGGGDAVLRDAPERDPGSLRVVGEAGESERGSGVVN